jgi:hypothetical protein
VKKPHLGLVFADNFSHALNFNLMDSTVPLNKDISTLTDKLSSSRTTIVNGTAVIRYKGHPYNPPPLAALQIKLYEARGRVI